MRHLIPLTDEQKKFILKAIGSITTLYDFDNLENEEFKESYGITKSELIKQTNELSEALR